MMVIEPASILFNRTIVRNGDIGTSGRYPGGQQPHVMTELAGKRRGGVIVCPMRQRQVMLRIENIDSFHDKSSTSTVMTFHSKQFYFTVMLTLDFMPVAGSLTVRVITPGVFPAWQTTTN